MFYILPYSDHSEAAQFLAQRTRFTLLTDENKHLVTLNEDDTVINYGNSHIDIDIPCKIYNKPANVAIAIDKVKCLNMLHRKEVRTIPFTSFKHKAKRWFPNEVICRTLTSSSCGHGIIVARNSDELQSDCKLFTKYMPNRREFRVHIVLGNMVDYCERRPSETAQYYQVNHHVRTHEQGWTFVRNVEDVPESILELAKQSVKAIGLDFGAVDLAYNLDDNLPYILEINTAPGNEIPTTDKYAIAFLRKFLGL